MPSNLVIIEPGSIRLPLGNDVDIELTSFGAPRIDTDLPPILLYLVNPPDDRVVTLAMEMNGTEVHRASYRTETRTFHDVIAAGSVREEDNVLTLRFLSGGGSALFVSSIALLYNEAAV